MIDTALFDQDRRALEPWGLGAILSAAIPASGAVNRTVLLQTSTGAFVLRISGRGRQRVEWEHKCLSWASIHGLPVCRPIPLPEGGTILEQEGMFYALFPLAFGQQVKREELRHKYIWAAGECLARVHAAFQTFPIECARIKNLAGDIGAVLADIPRIEAAIQTIPIRTETEAVAQAHLVGRRAWLEQTAPLAWDLQDRLASLPQFVLHGDYQETNLFFDARVVSAVIDWDQSGLAARGWEVVRALHLMLRLVPKSCHIFLDGYRSILPLSVGELEEAALCYGVLADSNLWVYKAVYLEGNMRAKRFMTPGPFIPFQTQWNAAQLR